MCPHATTTTVAWLYEGEDEAHATHVASCADCTAVVEEHERVASALAGVLPAMRRSETRRARRVPRWAVALAATALAAVGIGAWRLLPSPASPAPVVVAEVPPDRFDAELDDLDLDVTSLELEML